jgi:integrase
VALEMRMLNPVTKQYFKEFKKHDQTKKEAYRREEITTLLKTVETHKTPQLRLFVTLAAYTGMRAGEILGLEWKDVNFKERTIYIYISS